jgi:uncharacterized protein (DUF1015 family)
MADLLSWKIPNMAQISPFQPYRYASKAGNLNDLVTQPYDKITPVMQQRYLHASPYNLVRVILGPKQPGDNETDNVYTRSSRFFHEWIDKGILVKDAKPAFYAYFQEFTVPFTGEKLVRKGFIGLGPVEDYEAGIVHRHEQTLTGPKKDRRQVLDHTRAHFGQIFMLYPDPECRIDAILDKAATQKQAAEVRDEHDTIHRLFAITDPAAILDIQKIMADKKLLIADGHHRYETALAFRKDHPELEDAKKVMMTFVNMHSPGLRVLATHRVLNGLPNFDPNGFLKKAEQNFTVRKVENVEAVKKIFAKPDASKIRIGVAIEGEESAWLMERDRNGGLDVKALHEDLIEKALGVGEEAVRDEKHVKYMRGIEPAVERVVNGEAQIAFLLEPTTVQQTADTSFAGGVMPQKSTDFYPKMLTGMTIYRLEK